MATIAVQMARVESVGKGFFTVSEEIARRDGSKFKKYYKVWDDARVSEGDIVSVTGTFDAKPSVDFKTGLERKWTDGKGMLHTSIDVSINDADVRPFASRTSDPF